MSPVITHEGDNGSNPGERKFYSFKFSSFDLMIAVYLGVDNEAVALTSERLQQ